MTTALADCRRAALCLDGWAGYYEEPVLVVGETPKRYRVRPGLGVDRIRLPGRYRYLHRGETTLVPRHAIRFLEDHEEPRRL